jgi:signal transduction histidine kinase
MRSKLARPHRCLGEVWSPKAIAFPDDVELMSDPSESNIKDVSLCRFRVMQDALQNAVKYSGVKTFKVDLRGTQHSLELTVVGTGHGFEEQDSFASRSGSACAKEIKS